jgi:molybdopterin synthase catalytic subunit
MHITIRVQYADFSCADEYASLRARLAGRMGAVASFVGLVRDQSDDDRVKSLYLEHYPGMTERSLGDIVAEAERRWRLLDVVVIHRVGELGASEQIVFVQVAAGHRGEAFAACEFIMDYLKTRAVFWKREQSPSGSRWIEATGSDHQRISDWENS